MASKEQIEAWQRLGEEILGLAKTLRDRLSDQDYHCIEDFVDHNELGLGFDCLLAALLEASESRLEPIHAQTILRLGEEMGYSNDTDPFYRMFVQRFFPPTSS